MKPNRPARYSFIFGFVAMFPLLASAANVTWDANTATTGAQDGSGIWDTSSLNWWTGTANTIWDSVLPDTAFFGGAAGAAGTVTLGENIVSGNITFNAPGAGYYTLAGGGFHLGLTNRTIAANVNATISADIYGGSVTLANSAATAPSAVLALSGNNRFTNFNLGVNAAFTTAAARVGSSTALGVPTGTISIGGGQGNQTSHRLELVGNGITISNNVGWTGRNNASAAVVNLGTGNTLAGRWQRQGGGLDGHITSEVAGGLTLSGANNNGIAIDSVAPSARIMVLRGAGGGTVSGIISNGTVTTSIVKAGSGTWTLSGANIYTGGTIVNEGTLTLDYSTQNNSKLADAGVLTLAGGTLNLAGGSHTEINGSTTIGAGNSVVTRSSGSSTLRLNTITRNRGGAVNLGADGIADTDTANVNGILGGYATVAGADWAMNSTGGGDGAVTAYTGYTDIAATGSTIANSAASNVRLNSAGGGGSIALGAATTTVNTLLQNTTTAATVNTAGGVLRLGVTGGVLVRPGAQSLTLGTTPDAGTITAGGAADAAGELILINNSANALTVNATLADNGLGPVSLTKAGSSTATLTGNNTHTGTNSIVGGTLNISSDANLGAAPFAPTPGTILINGGVLQATETFELNGSRGIALGPTSRYGNGTLSVASDRLLVYNGIIANADTTGNGPGGSLTKTGSGTLVLGGANTYTFGTIINAGTVSISSSGNLGPTPQCYIPDHLVINGGTLVASAPLTLGAARGIFLGPVGGSGGGTFLVEDGVTLQLDSRIADNWNGAGALTKTGNGTLTLASPFNDYSGNTTVSAGTLQLNNGRAIPNGPGKGNLVLNGLLNVNNVNTRINGLSGNGVVDNQNFGDGTLTVGYNDASGTFSGTIQSTFGGVLSLNKVGAGTLTLTGPLGHNGATLVSGGVLALSGAATPSASTNFTVLAGATLNVSGLAGGLTLGFGQTLAGTGTVQGNVNHGSGAILAPGTSAGTLTVNGNLTLGGGSLNYEVRNVTTIGAGVNDLTIVTGNLTVAGPTTLDLTYLDGIPAAAGKYTLITYAGTYSGNVNDITVPAGFTISNNVVAKAIELVIEHIPANLTWRGDGFGNVWDLNTAPNWRLGSSPATFFNGDTANFDNSGSNTPAIFVSTPVIASAVNVNASQTYTFTGSAISGGGLTKSGSGTLVLENDNNYIAGTTISGGALQIGNTLSGGFSGTLGGGGITNNALLVFDRSDSLVLGSAISGSGGVMQTGPGATGLTASNSYAGLTTLTAGTIHVANGAALGSKAAGTVVQNGAQLYITVNVNVGDEALTLSGSGPAADGALRKGGGGASIYGGAVTLVADATIKLDGNATLNLTNATGITSSGQHLTLTGDGGSQGIVAGPINLGGGAGTLTKSGPGTWTLGGANSMSLAPVTGGALVLANNNALGTNLNVVLQSTTGGPGLSGTRLTLSGGLSIPANRSLSMPSSGAGSVRSAFFGTGAGLTNTWAGPVNLFGDFDPGNWIAFGADNNSTFVISGNVTADASFPGRLFLRGNGSGGGSTGLGIITGTIALNPISGQVQVEDGATWILASSGHTWTTTFFANSSRLILGAHNALPTATAITLTSGANNRLDLGGFNQTLSSLEIGAGLNITNSSSSADSTLSYAAAGNSTFGGTISDGTRKLNLSLASGMLTLTSPTTLNLTKSTISVAGGGPLLQLDYVGTNTVNAFVTNGVSVPAGLYNSLTSPGFLGGVGNLLVVPGPASPVTLTNIVIGNTLNLSWPAGEGWRLQAQTNNLATGISNNWVYVTDGSVSSANFTLNPANPTVFFRLRYP